MANIPNPLGNLGTSQAVLPDMTAGVQALQRTEIQRRLEEIEQDKKWQREDNLRNEAFALKMATTDVVNDARVGIANRAMEQAEEFKKKNTEMWRKAGEERRSISLPEKMELIQEQQKILQNNAQAASFANALEQAQGTHMSMLKSLKDPETRAQYEQQWAELYKKMQDPEGSTKLSSADVIEAIQPPPPSVNAIMGDWDTQLIPKIDSAVSIDPKTGAKRFNRAAAMETIEANLKSDPYGVERVKEQFGYTTDQQVYEHVLDRVKTSVGITGGRAGDGGAGTTDRPYEFVPNENIVTRKGTEKSGVTIPNWKSPIKLVNKDEEVKDEEGNYPIVDFTPIYVVPDDEGKGYVAGGRIEVEADEEIIIPDMALAYSRAIGASMSKPKPVKFDANGDPTEYSVTFKEKTTLEYEVPYERVKAEMENRLGSEFTNTVKSTKGKKIVSNPSAEEYAKLKSGDKFMYNGVEYTKE